MLLFNSFNNSKVLNLHSFYILNVLTLILPKPKLVILFHQYRARPACTSSQSYQALYWWLTGNEILLLQVLILISLKMVMESSKNGRWIIPFKEFSRIRVKFTSSFCYHVFPLLRHTLYFNFIRKKKIYK